MIFRYRLLGFLLLCGACSEIEDASPMNRTTFVRFYESGNPQEGVVAKEIAGGYVVLGNSVTPADTTGLVMRTDISGNVQWKTSLGGVILRSLAIGPDALYIAGDSIRVNPESSQLADLIIHSIHLYKIDFNGTLLQKISITDRATETRTDYKASAITLNGQNQLILLGTQLAATPSSRERPFLTAFNTSTLDTVWAKAYEIIDRDYVNSRSVHATDDGYIVWASAILKQQQSFSRTYLSIPFIKEGSAFENSDVYGATTDQQLLAGDIQPANSSAFGFGVIGTYATPSGENSNMFFARVDRNGNFMAGSERFFDGQSSAFDEPVGPAISQSQDTGDVLCATQDGGFVLGGTMLTTPERGNGGKDIFFVKVDALGTMEWNRLMGGIGDEIISSMEETSDGGLVICGSKDADGLPAIFLIKTDKDGKIED